MATLVLAYTIKSLEVSSLPLFWFWRSLNKIRLDWNHLKTILDKNGSIYESFRYDRIRLEGYSKVNLNVTGVVLASHL